MRDEIIDYLYKSGFVANYVKKLMFPSDIDDLYEDYLQETWLALLEVDEEKWTTLYKRRPDKDDFYDVRNYVSVVIRNTVKSTTSAAYRRLKRQGTVTRQLDSDEWKLMENTVEDDTDIYNTRKGNEPEIS